MTKHRLLCLCSMMLAIGCAAPEGDLFSLLAYDRQSDSYTIQEVEITTLEDVASLRGTAAHLLVSSNLEINYVEGYIDWMSKGSAPDFRAIETGGVLVPEDYDSLAMASIYYNLEQAQLFYRSIGMPQGMLVDIPAYYETVFHLVESEVKEYDAQDNAFYMSYDDGRGSHVRAFFILPFDQFQWVPLAMNTGVVTHEFTHAVFDELVLDPARETTAKWDDASGNFLLSLNEGLADFMAVVLTGDPDFISHSVPANTFGGRCNTETVTDVSRRADVPVTYTTAMDARTRSIDSQEYCPYELGTFVASFLYGMARRMDGLDDSETPRDPSLNTIAEVVYETLGRLRENLGEAFEIGHFLDLFGDRMEATLPGEGMDLFCDHVAESISVQPRSEIGLSFCSM